MFVHKMTLALTAVGVTLLNPVAMAESGLYEAIGSGNVYANLNARYERVDQRNALRDASAMTLRTRLGYRTGAFNGFSAVLELEDSRIVAGQDKFTVGPTGFNPGGYSVIADPETTELDQGFLEYKGRKDAVTIRLGRQIITYDGHRFVGHVGWRQDRQTFDAATIQYKPAERLTLDYGHVNKRNRIFAEAADIDSNDHLLNAAYTTPFGAITGYAYLLEVDDASANGLDTYGLSFRGSKGLEDISVQYAIEYASQESSTGIGTFDADYMLAEAGVVLPKLTVKLGYELLGSDSGTYGFSTPLATLHKFNGWSDQFLGTPVEGLKDTYLSLHGKLAGIGWLAAYHDFAADESSASIDDFGDEIDIQLTRQFAGNYTVGLKYAAYKAGDAAAGKVDTDKLWAWFTTGF